MDFQHRNIAEKRQTVARQSRKGSQSERIEKNISVLFCILSVYKYNIK